MFFDILSLSRPCALGNRLGEKAHELAIAVNEKNNYVSRCPENSVPQTKNGEADIGDIDIEGSVLTCYE